VCNLVGLNNAATDYGPDTQSSISGRAKGFYCSICIHTSSGNHSAAYLVCTRGHFSGGGKCGLLHGADHSHPHLVSSSRASYRLMRFKVPTAIIIVFYHFWVLVLC
jgi:hypothetical protein